METDFPQKNQQVGRQTYSTYPRKTQKGSDMAETSKINHDGDATEIPLTSEGYVPRERGVAARPPPAAGGVRRHRRGAAVLSLVTLLCPPSSGPAGGIETSPFAVGFVNVAPIASGPIAAPTRGGPGRRNGGTPFFLNSPADATMTDPTASSPPRVAAANETAVSAPRTTRTTDERAPPRKNDGRLQRRGVWMPPSQNPGMIFSIQQPQDLLDFVIEDERLGVGESRSICEYVIPRSPFFLRAISHSGSRDASESLRQLVQDVPSLRHALSKIGLAIRRRSLAGRRERSDCEYGPGEIRGDAVRQPEQ